MQTKSLACILIFLLFSIVGCSTSNDKQNLPVVRLGHSPHDHHSPLYIAAMNSEYFKVNGGIYLNEITKQSEYELVKDGKKIAQMHLSSSTGGNMVIRKLAEDQFDLALGGIPAMINFIDQGSCIKILSPIMTDGAGFILRKDIPVSNWHEFVNFVKNHDTPLRIGYKINTSVQNLIFENALMAENISYSKSFDKPSSETIQLINLHGAKNLIPALENTLIDGFVVNQPFLAIAEYRGIGKLVATLGDLSPENKWKGTPCCALSGCIKFSEKHPKITQAIIALLSKASTFIKDHPDKAAQQISQWLDIPLEVEQKSLPTITFVSEFNELWHKGVEFWIKTMIDTQVIKGEVKKAYEENSLNKILYHSEFHSKDS